MFFITLEFKYLIILKQIRYNLSINMGGILDTPHTEKTTETGDGNQCRFAVCSMQGWRVEMEDAHCAKIGLPQLKDWNFFAGKSFIY